jgi:hypothetical protein
MSKQEAETSRTKTGGTRDERANLDRQYGRIGISAVAAALPFAGQTKNTHHQASDAHDSDHQSADRRRSVLAV